MTAEPSLGRVYDAVTRLEMKVDFMRDERTADKAALDKQIAADKETRAAERAAQEKVNEKHATEIQLLRDSQQQRKGISGAAALVFGAVAGAVVSFGLSQLVSHSATTPQTQTNCGTFVVVGSVCPQSAKAPSVSKGSDVTEPGVSAVRPTTAAQAVNNRRAPQRPASAQNRHAVATVPPKAKVKKPPGVKPKKAHRKGPKKK